MTGGKCKDISLPKLKAHPSIGYFNDDFKDWEQLWKEKKISFNWNRRGRTV